jgi:hypothetical protein
MVAGMITPAQCRASRGYLDWTQQRLSAASGLSLSLIKDFESGLRVPHTANQARLKATLEQAGIVFATGGVTSAAGALDAFWKIAAPTAEQTGAAIAAAHRVALAGGRRPELSEGARSIVRAYEKSLGIGEDECARGRLAICRASRSSATVR